MTGLRGCICLDEIQQSDRGLGELCRLGPDEEASDGRLGSITTKDDVPSSDCAVRESGTDKTFLVCDVNERFVVLSLTTISPASYPVLLSS